MNILSNSLFELVELIKQEDPLSLELEAKDIDTISALDSDINKFTYLSLITTKLEDYLYTRLLSQTTNSSPYINTLKQLIQFTKNKESDELTFRLLISALSPEQFYDSFQSQNKLITEKAEKQIYERDLKGRQVEPPKDYVIIKTHKGDIQHNIKENSSDFDEVRFQVQL